MLLLLSQLSLSQAHSNDIGNFACRTGMQPYKCPSINTAVGRDRHEVHPLPRTVQPAKKESIWKRSTTVTEDGNRSHSVTASREHDPLIRTTTTYSCIFTDTRVISYLGLGLHYDLLPEETATIGKEYQVFSAKAANGRTTSVKKEWDTYHTLNVFLWSINDEETPTEDVTHSLKILLQGKEITTEIQGQEYVFTTQGLNEAVKQTYKKCEEAALLTN